MSDSDGLSFVRNLTKLSTFHLSDSGANSAYFAVRIRLDASDVMQAKGRDNCAYF